MVKQNKGKGKGKPKAMAPQPKANTRRRPRRLPLTAKARATIGSVNALDKLAANITLPHETKPIRYPQAGLARKTGVLKLVGEAPLLSTSYYITPTWNTVVGLCPSPVHPVWMTTYFPTQVHLYRANYTFDDKGLNAPLTSFNSQSQFAVYPGVVDDSDAAYVHVPKYSRTLIILSGVTGTNGAVSIVVRYITRLSELKHVTVSLTTVAGTGVFEFDQLIPAQNSVLAGTWIQVVSVTGPSGMVIANSSVTIQVTSGGVVGAIGGASTLFLPAFRTLESENLTAASHEARVNSNSLLVTNTSPNLMKAGTFDAAMLEYRNYNVFDFPTHFDQVTSRNTSLRYAGPAEKGLYTYSVPSPDSQQFSDYIDDDVLNAVGSIWTGPVYNFDLRDAAYMNIGVYSPSQATNTSGNSVIQTFIMLYDEHREFVTTSQLYPLSNCNITLQAYQSAVIAASRIVPFTENPLHWSTLATLVSGALKGMRPHVMPMARAGVDYMHRRALDYLQ